MLILTRKPGESLYIGDHIKVIIVEIKGNQIRVGIEAPSDVRIYREEIYLQILEENRKAAEAVSAEGLEGLSESWKGLSGGGEGAAKSLLSGAKVTKPLTPTPTQPSASSQLSVTVKRKKGAKSSDE